MAVHVYAGHSLCSQRTQMRQTPMQSIILSAVELGVNGGHPIARTGALGANQSFARQCQLIEIVGFALRG